MGSNQEWEGAPRPLGHWFQFPRQAIHNGLWCGTWMEWNDGHPWTLWHIEWLFWFPIILEHQPLFRCFGQMVRPSPCDCGL